MARFLFRRIRVIKLLISSYNRKVYNSQIFIYFMGYHEQLQGLDIRRRAALGNRDARAYRDFCDELGLPPSAIEDPDLYERGEPVSRLAPSRHFHSGPGSIMVARYREFMQGAKDLLLDKLEADSSAKRNLLTIFPRFRKEGPQPVERLTDARVGKVFLGVYKTARKHAL